MSHEQDIVLSLKEVWKIFGSVPKNQVVESTLNEDLLLSKGLIPAVQNVSVDIRRGEIFVIMGLSGSGKSTLLRCMTRLYSSEHGRIVFDGHDLMRLSKRELSELRKRRMGMVFQSFALLPHLTVLDNVAFPLEIQKVAKEERRKRAREVVELVGLGDRIDYFPNELSGGQQQRVGIARSLVAKPDIWFLDEPFSALDPIIRREMQDEFIRLQSVLRKTIVFVTHDFDEATRLADRIAIMKDGKIVQVGSPEALVTTPASDYVKKFTEHVSRESVLTVQTVMKPATRQFDVTISAHRKVVDAARLLLSTGSAIGVTDEEGRIVGELTQHDVLSSLVGE